MTLAAAPGTAAAIHATTGFGLAQLSAPSPALLDPRPAVVATTNPNRLTLVETVRGA